MGMTADPRDLSLPIRLEAARASLEANLQSLEQVLFRLQNTQTTFANGRSRREILHESAYARLMARLDTLPVIEQAKGILMARSGCSPDEAFDVLRRASQRMNVPVQRIAQDLVQRTVRPAGHAAACELH
jgi:hypothetical protein